MSGLCAVGEGSPHKALTTRLKRPSVGISRRASAFMRALQSTRADPDHSKDVDPFTQINYSSKKMTESACFVSLCQSLRRRPLMECAPNRQKPLSAVCSYRREIRRLECSHFLFILFSIMKNCSTGEVIRNYCRAEDVMCLISVWGAQLESQQFHITSRLLQHTSGGKKQQQQNTVIFCTLSADSALQSMCMDMHARNCLYSIILLPAPFYLAIKRISWCLGLLAPL